MVNVKDSCDIKMFYQTGAKAQTLREIFLKSRLFEQDEKRPSYFMPVDDSQYLVVIDEIDAYCDRALGGRSVKLNGLDLSAEQANRAISIVENLIRFSEISENA